MELTNPPPPPEEAAAKAASKRYETLMTIRTRAIQGKGSWYWAHLEPLLILSDNGLPKAVKLKCSHCGSTFSASNPSRTSTDHLMKGACPNFTSPSSDASLARPISSAPPLNIKRPKRPKHLLLPSTTPQPQPPLVLSGGKEDLGALAMLEDSVRRLKSPKTSPGPPLPKQHADAALSSLAEWVLESCGDVSLAALNHPKFREFLRQVGLPPVDPRCIVGPVLESRYREVCLDTNAKIQDATFYQLSSSGWRKQNGEHKLVNFALNLPNGNSVFLRALITTASAPSEYAEDVIWDAINGTLGGIAERCVGIVADRFGSKALRNIGNQHHWMVNFSCQVQAITSLIKDFARELNLFETAVANCFKLVSYFNKQSKARSILHKYQLPECDRSRLLRAPHHIEDAMTNFDPVFSMLEDVMGSIGPLQLAVLDEDYKLLCGEDREAVELMELIQDVGFWGDVEAVHSIVKLIKKMASEMEVERPLVGQCLPLWNELRAKVRDWCNKFSVEFGLVDTLIEKRFKKNYHPAWSVAFVLDPLYLVRDSSGKYLPPFKLLTPEQEKDVDKLITRLVTREEAHIALMELMKWRTEGLDPLYAQAVQVKQPDPCTGKMKIANPQSSRLVWETCLSEFKTLGKVSVRLIFLHATATCGLSPGPPMLDWLRGHGQSKSAIERAQKMASIAAHAKLERRDFSTEEQDSELIDGEALEEAPSV